MAPLLLMLPESSSDFVIDGHSFSFLPGSENVTTIDRHSFSSQSMSNLSAQHHSDDSSDSSSIDIFPSVIIIALVWAVSLIVVWHFAAARAREQILKHHPVHHILGSPPQYREATRKRVIKGLEEMDLGIDEDVYAKLYWFCKQGGSDDRKEWMNLAPEVCLPQSAMKHCPHCTCTSDCNKIDQDEKRAQYEELAQETDEELEKDEKLKRMKSQQRTFLIKY